MGYFGGESSGDGGGDVERKVQGLITWDGTAPAGTQPKTLITFADGELLAGDAVRLVVEHRPAGSWSHGDPDDKAWDSTFWDEAHLEDGDGNLLQQSAYMSFSTGRFRYMIREYSGQALVILEEDCPFAQVPNNGLWIPTALRQPTVESGFMTGSWSLVYSALAYNTGHPNYAYFVVDILRAKQGG